ncbi:MAG: hypothetical protein HY672_00740 [Chloroflexi bacterium]|nr:hypothetical protein [Chloroflexota bacterium]
MKVYWREHRTGQRLILDNSMGQQEEVGSVRRTPRGFDAIAITSGYDPGRARRGFTTLDDAKAFVESFHPWDVIVGSTKVEFDTTVHPMTEESQ